MGEFWVKTIELYQNFITFPEITERYLKRPPFKYLFQVFLSVNKKTNFASALLSQEEQDPEFYNSPEKKMAFLKKLIMYVYKTLGKQPQVKPLSIIKGEECDKTNEFLCDLYLAATAPRSSVTNEEQKQKEKAENVPNVVSPSNFEKKNSIVKKGTENLTGTKTNIDNERAPKKTAMGEKPKEKENEKASMESKQHSKANEEKQLGNEILKNIEKDEKLLARGDEPKSIKMGRIIDKKGESAPEAELPIDEIRGFIQKITQNTNPLGKLIDYAEDDLNNMSKEYKNWTRLYHEASAKLEKLEGDQDDELQAYSQKILQLDEQILDFQEKIGGLRGKIFKTDQRISQLLQKIVD